MSKHTHAPGWRGRTKRTGPIADDDLPGWILFLDAIAVPGCFAVAAVTLALAAYAFGVDRIAGHW